MRIRILQKNPYAVSEVIGALLLVIIAVCAAVAIYNYMLPVPLPIPEPNVHLRGYVTEQGNAIIEHVGGDTLNNYLVYINGEFNQTYSADTLFRIGDKISISSSLYDENNNIKILIYTRIQDGNKAVIFEGTLAKTIQGNNDVIDPLITSLETNTIDEDILCYADPSHIYHGVQTYIYNWTKNGNPFASLLYPFDSNNRDTIKDYSGNENHGTGVNVSWISNGKIGGALFFNGTSLISIPYVFSSQYIPSFTIETWMKSTQQSAPLTSFNRGKYWQLGMADGKPQLITSANGEIFTLSSDTMINDNSWHHLAASYDSSTGTSKLYVDGILDTVDTAHAPGSLIGDGSTPMGFIGKEEGQGQETIFSTSFETTDERDQWQEDDDIWGGEGGSITWENYFFDNFDFWWWGRWGNWNSGGSYSSLDNSGSHSYDGLSCVRLRRQSGWASSTYTNIIHAQSAGYKQMSLDFRWKPVNLLNGQQLHVLYYDGSSTHHVESFTIGTDGYVNNQMYHSIVIIDNEYYPFTNAARFVLRSETNTDSRSIYIDHIYVNVTTGGRVEYEFDRLPASIVNPYSGEYSLGGTGDLQSEYAYFNRSGINIAGYTDVELSVWYSYKNTGDPDSFGLFYKHDGSWIPIFTKNDINIGSGQQSDWVHVQSLIPDEIDILELQFRWSTSSSASYVIIDELIITGCIPGGGNFIGFLDELKIYPHVLSDEQIYQLFIQASTGIIDVSVIVASQTKNNDIWQCFITPNDGQKDYALLPNNIIIKIGNYGGG